MVESFSLLFTTSLIIIFIIIIFSFYEHKNIFLSLGLDRERARYEATVHLGNASSQVASDIRNERRRIMEYLPVFLEKHVSKNNFSFSRFYTFCVCSQNFINAITFTVQVSTVHFCWYSYSSINIRSIEFYC